MENVEEESQSNKIEYYEDYNTYLNKTKERRDRAIENFAKDERFNTKEKLIKILELEFIYLENQQKALIYSNEEMLKFDVSDLDLIESRAENLKFLSRNMKRMKEIKEELSVLDQNNSIVRRMTDMSLSYDEEKVIEEIEL